MKLLKSEDGLQQFESLMALTNLSLYNEEIVELILKDNGFNTIEMLQLDNHELIQRAGKILFVFCDLRRELFFKASELLCNLLIYPNIIEKYYYEPNITEGTLERRLKIWAGLSQSGKMFYIIIFFNIIDDEYTCIAASGI